MIDYKLLTEFEEQKTQLLQRFISNQQNKQQIKDSKTELIMRKLEKRDYKHHLFAISLEQRNLEHLLNEPVTIRIHLLIIQRSNLKNRLNMIIKRNNSSYDFVQHINQVELNVQNKEVDSLFRPMQDRRQKTPLKMKLQQLEYGRNYQKLVDKIIELDKNPINFKKNLYI